MRNFAKKNVAIFRKIVFFSQNSFSRKNFVNTKKNLQNFAFFRESLLKTLGGTDKGQEFQDDFTRI